MEPDAAGCELGAPQMPALLFSLASCPMLGPAVGVMVFLIPALALDHRAPKASPLLVAVLEDEIAGFKLAELVGIAPPAGCGGAATCTDWK